MSSATFFFLFSQQVYPVEWKERWSMPWLQPPQHLCRRTTIHSQVYLWTPRFLTSPTCSLAVLQVELRRLQQDFFHPQEVTIAKQSNRKPGCTNNIPHFPQGWGLMAPLHNLSHPFFSAQISFFIPSGLPWTESRFSHRLEPWTSRKISKRNLEICSSTWLWKLWALPGCYLWKLANFQPGYVKSIYEIVHM